MKLPFGIARNLLYKPIGVWLQLGGSKLFVIVAHVGTSTSIAILYGKRKLFSVRIRGLDL